MNIIRNICLLLVVSAAIFSSCSNSKLPDDSLSKVPEDVTSVTAFNMNQLMQKADYEYIQRLDFFKESIAKLKAEKPALAAILENPMLSGVDLTKNAYMIMDFDKNQPKEKQFGGLVFSVKDAVQFESMLQDISEKEAEVRTGFRFMKDGSQMVAWNKDFGIIAGGHQSIDLEAYVSPFFDNKRKTSIVDNKDLVKCLGQDYDIAMWLNTNTLAENEQLKTAASFIGISKESLKNNYVHSFLNFENGAITGESKHLLQKELTNDLKLFFKEGVKNDLSKYIPGDDLGFVFGAALDPKGIYQVITEKTGGATTVNAGLKKFGFTSKDLANAFGGDMVVAVYGNMDHPTGLLTATIGDKNLFHQFVDLGVEYDVLVSEGEGLYIAKEGPLKNETSYLLVQEDVFFLSNQKAMLEKIRSGGYTSAERIPKDIYSSLSDNAFGGFMNMEAMKDLKRDLKHMPFTTARMDAGLKSSHLQLELKNKDVNSLKVIFGLLNEMYLQDEKGMKKIEPASLEI